MDRGKIKKGIKKGDKKTDALRSISSSVATLLALYSGVVLVGLEVVLLGEEGQELEAAEPCEELREVS